MKRLALCLVTSALACADPGPMGPELPLEASVVCGIELMAGLCTEATGSVTLEILVVSVTPVP